MMKNFGGMGNMLKQAQAVQQRMSDLQTQLETLSFEGSAGGGAVKVTLTGKGVLTGVHLDAAAVVADEKDVLEDLIVAACNDARSKADAHAEAQMKAITGGLQLPPGLKLPF